MGCFDTAAASVDFEAESELALRIPELEGAKLVRQSRAGLRPAWRVKYP
jgi:hypothetical protein